jgi:ABC-type antimicrobial peptide transport system permease subunit
MTGSLFGRLMRSISGSTILMLLLGVVLLAAGLAVGAMSALAWESPPQLNSARMLVLLDNQLLNVEIDNLYLVMREWPEIRTPQFALNVRDLNLPPTISVPSAPGFLLHLRNANNAAAVIEKAQGLGGVQQVLPLDEGNVTTVLLESQTLRPLLLAIFVVLILASFFALSGTVRRLLKRWRGELEMLRLSGIPRKQVVSSFAVVGVFGGGLGALFGALLVYVAYLLGKSNPSLLYQYLPSALNEERMIGLAIAALIIGLLVGVVSGAWGTRKRNLS